MAQNRDSTGNVTFDSSPGGLFDTGGDNTSATSVAESTADARRYAEYAKEWAVGESAPPFTGFSDTNNSKYWAEQAAMHANSYDSETIKRYVAEADSEAERARSWAVGPSAPAPGAYGTDVNNSHYWAQRSAASAAAAAADSDEIAQVVVDVNNAVADARAAAMQAAMDSDEAAASAAAASASNVQAGNARDAAILARNAAQSAESGAQAAELAAQEASGDSQNFRDQAREADSDAQRVAHDLSGFDTEFRAYAAGLESDFDTELAEARGEAQSAAAASSESTRQAGISRHAAYIAQTWAVGPGGDTDSEGTATNNAHYWAMQAQSHSAAANVSDSEIQLVAGLGISGGGNFTLNGDSDTITFNLDSENIVNASRSGNNVTLTYANGNTLEFPVGGGGTGPIDTDLRLSLNPGEIELNISGTQVVQANLSAPGFTLSNQTFHVADPDNNNVPISGSGNARDITLSRTTRRNITVSATATLTRTSDSQVFNNVSAQGTVEVNVGWYRDLISAAPTGINTMDNQGVWSSGEHNTQTLTANNTGRHLYYALPIRSAGYRFHSGFVVYDATNLGNINNGSGGSDFWTLYRIEDFDDSQNGSTFTVTIEEA